MDGSELAKFIDLEIEKRGLKKKTFYEATKISSATLSQWRTGLYNPSEENVKQVEKFFGVKITSTIDEKEKSPAPNGTELNPNYYNLSPENKFVIDNLIEKLLKSQSDN